jgi:hypothetical protein
MRACDCDTASRLCVRTVLCRSAFPLVPPLRSTGSAAACAALFVRFIATMGKSDFSGPFISGFGLRPSQSGPGLGKPRRPGDIPVSAQEMSVHARVFYDAGLTGVSRFRRTPCCLMQDGKHRYPKGGFRRSMTGPHAPLSTRRRGPREPPRMTQGRCGSLDLRRKGLSPSISRCTRPPHHVSSGTLKTARLGPWIASAAQAATSSHFAARNTLKPATTVS